MSSPAPNANVPQIPQPVSDVGALAFVCQQLKQGVDSLAGNRGPTLNRAVTFNDLITYGFTTAANIGASSAPPSSALASEVIARISGDSVNSGAITAETTRATAAEATLTTSASTNATAITTETTRATTAEALKTPLTTANIGQYKGTTTNDSATAGNVGEFISSTILLASAVALTSSTSANVTSISLTAGDWDAWGVINFSPAGTTVVTQVAGAIGPTTATLSTRPNGGSFAELNLTFAAGAPIDLPVGTRRVSIATTTTFYLVASQIFTTSTMSAYGFIGARRVR